MVASVGVAKLVEKRGAAAVIAEGGESGGHIGELTTMALVPQVCDAVKIPVIAAGGIADGRQLAAAFMLGAVGVQVGTRFLVAKECTISPVYKEKILKAKDIDTISTGRRLGHPVRALKTPFTRELAHMEYDSNISDLSVSYTHLIPADIDMELLRRNVQLLFRCLNDAQIGLMWQHVIHILLREPRFFQYDAHIVAHSGHREFVDFLSIHI